MIPVNTVQRLCPSHLETMFCPLTSFPTPNVAVYEEALCVNRPEAEELGHRLLKRLHQQLGVVLIPVPAAFS